MKITDVRCLVADGGSRNVLFVVTETDEGITGIGEAFSVGPDLAVPATVDYLKDWFIGEDPRNIEYIWALMYQGLRYPPGAVSLAAMSGIEHTLWDIAGKAVGLPVYKLLGGAVRDKVRVYQGVHGRTPEEAAEQALRLIDRYGYTALKMSPYPPEWEMRLWNDVLVDGPRIVEAVRKAVGDDVEIAIDAHARVFEPVRALELADALLPYRPMFIEEPLRAENIRALAYLRRKFHAPLATGEALLTKFEFNELLFAEAADIVQPDACICGGLMEMRKIAALAEAHDVVVAPHNPMGPVAAAVNVHFAAATNNFLILEYVPHDQGLRRNFVKDPWMPRDGYLDLPTKPGWGIELDFDGIARHPYKAWRRGNPRRPDNSPAFI
jgi:galactonate dehydratase